MRVFPPLEIKTPWMSSPVVERECSLRTSQSRPRYSLWSNCISMKAMLQIYTDCSSWRLGFGETCGNERVQRSGPRCEHCRVLVVLESKGWRAKYLQRGPWNGCAHDQDPAVDYRVFGSNQCHRFSGWTNYGVEGSAMWIADGSPA
jgi:hypothetical protein